MRMAPTEVAPPQKSTRKPKPRRKRGDVTKPRDPAEAEKALAEATEQVIHDGGVGHEDAMWDANEMALDGASVKSMAERIKKERAEPYRPEGGWSVRR
jgi:hypothetical protein